MEMSQFHNLNHPDKATDIMFIQDINLGIQMKNGIRYYLINMEQLSKYEWRDRINQIRRKFPSITIFDYSLENIEYVNELIYLPYPFTEKSVWQNISKEKTYDFGFCGCLSDYRNKLLTGLKDRGYSVNIIDDKFGTERDFECSKCKILLNIHCNERFDITEVLRIYPYLFNKHLIISQTSKFCIIEPYKDFIIWSNYEDFVNKCEEVINNYEYHYNYIFNDDSEIKFKQLNHSINSLVNILF
jgi:hypothetical protein